MRVATDDDAIAIADIHWAALQSTLAFLPRLHDHVSVRQFFAECVLRSSRVMVATAENHVAGFIAIRPGWIDHLYVDAVWQRRGIGSALLDIPIAEGAPFRLWTFQRNEAAQRFYLSRGLRPLEHTDGAQNDEREPDTLFGWPGMPLTALSLREPVMEMVSDLVAAMNAGWSPNSERDGRPDERDRLARDAAGHLQSLRTGEGTVTIADGTQVPRLPGNLLWLWDGQFCGNISFRYQPGSEELPPYTSGHVGYNVVPWKRRRGYATQALAMILPFARAAGMSRVLLTCDEDNAGSRAVILANGGVAAGREAGRRPGIEKLRFWVPTSTAGEPRVRRNP